LPSAVGAIDGSVMTIGHSLPPADDHAASCAKGFAKVDRSPQPIVERIGIEGRSVTFVEGSRVFACDAAAGAREGSPDSCGGAAGRREGGVLTDPRLDVANCIDADSHTVAFVWIEPAEDAGYLGVERDEWVEIYPTRAGLPVRVATTEGIGDDNSSLSLTVTQYAADGRELGEEGVRAQVAG
jgi:hypothetical protein